MPAFWHFNVPGDSDPNEALSGQREEFASVWGTSRTGTWASVRSLVLEDMLFESEEEAIAHLQATSQYGRSAIAVRFRREGHVEWLVGAYPLG